LIVNQKTAIDDIKGYEKFFFIGGSASWGNIRGVLKNNIGGLRLYEEENYKGGKHIDVWGISDLELFRQASAVLKKETKPFFAVIQTAGYHRPYTIPDDNAGFVYDKNFTDEELQKASFHGVEEYNSLRFSDHALGEFIKQAKADGYYDKTIFVIFGDHGLASNTSGAMPKGYQAYNLINHQVPLIIHAPAVLEPQVIGDAASQIDIVPTVAGIIGAGYSTNALGRDMLDEKNRSKSGAFIYTWSDYPPTIAFARGGLLDYNNRKAGVFGLFDYNSENFDKDLSAQEPQKAQEMKDLAFGLYETARYLLFNNPKKK